MQAAGQSLDFYLLIPSYNNLDGLISSLKSICYNPEKFAVLIVDDGSTVVIDSASLLVALDAGISVNIIRLPVNQGITKALNHGMQWLARRHDYRFVARLDCGDICHKNRFTDQVTYLEQHPETDLVGTWCVFKNHATGSSYRFSSPAGHKRIMRQMYFRNVFIHPTVMWRAFVMHNATEYPDSFPHAEDYAFFYEILNRGRGAVIPKKLVTCEINHAGISIQHRKMQLKSRMQVVKRYGRNKMLVAAGIARLRLLMIIPYPLIIKAKQLLFQ